MNGNGIKKINWTPELIQTAKEVYNGFYIGDYKYTYIAEEVFRKKTKCITSWRNIKDKVERGLKNGN